MKKILQNIAEVKTGIFVRTEAEGDVVYLQARDFDDTGKLVSRPQPGLKMNAAVKRHLLKKGDVLVAAKGTKIFASAFEGGFPAVTSTTFLVLRPNQFILSAYLAWLLNSRSIQSRLKRAAMGTSLISISKSALAKLELDIPRIEKQKKVLEILELHKKEQDLRKRIAGLRQKMVEQALVESTL